MARGNRDFGETQDTASSSTPEVNRSKFECLLSDHITSLEQKQGYSRWTPTYIKDSIKLIEEFKASRTAQVTLSHHHYNRSQVYDTKKMNGRLQLIKKKKKKSDPSIVVLPFTEFYPVLSRIHKQGGHCGRDKMMKLLKKDYDIPKWAVEIFLPICEFCQSKKIVRAAKPVVE